MRRRSPQEKQRAREQHKREYLDHYERVWVPAIDETGPHWAETVTTESWVYVTARAPRPPQGATTARSPRVPVKVMREALRRNPGAQIGYTVPYAGR